MRFFDWPIFGTKRKNSVPYPRRLDSNDVASLCPIDIEVLPARLKDLKIVNPKKSPPPEIRLHARVRHLRPSTPESNPAGDPARSFTRSLAMFLRT